ncbi:MAG: GGDEF domain-containing protein [Spirochaetales bacterium]|nr:GGDEF domain-containing protein [Spirochaetales bacterium]
MKRTRRTTIGLLINAINGRYQEKLWPGVLAAAKEHSANCLLFIGQTYGTHLTYHYQHNIVYELINKKLVDGLVIVSGVISVSPTHKEFVRFLSRFKGFPSVSITMKLDGVPTIMIDNTVGFAQLIEHLIQAHHHRRIAFIQGPENNYDALIRFQTYQDVLARNNIEYDPLLVQRGNFVEQSGYESVMRFSDKNVDYTALVSSNDEMALGAIRALREKGVKIPEDVAIVGFDDIQEAQYNNIPLSTVRQPIFEQGKMAAEILLARINGEPVEENLVMPTDMVLRHSCGCFLDSIIQLESKAENISQSKDLPIDKKELQIELVKNIDNILEQTAYNRFNLKNWAAEISRTLIGCLDGEPGVNFLYILQKIMIDLIKEKKDVDILQKVITVIHEFLKQYKMSAERRDSVNDLLHNARILIAGSMKTEQATLRINFGINMWLLSYVVQELITRFDIKQLIQAIYSQFPSIGIHTCFVVLYKNPVTHFPTKEWRIPDHSRLVLGYTEKGRKTYEGFFKTETLLPENFLPDENLFSYAVMPLFFKEEQYGYFIFSISDVEPVIYEILQTQISSALKGSLLFKERMQAEMELMDTLKKLEISNKKFMDLSIKDELTGLFNRRGFLSLGRQYYDMAKRNSKDFVLFFADLDDLKLINDTYGHDEGDLTLLAASKILSDTFRTDDIIARYGGDEFTAIVPDKGINLISEIESRLYKSIDLYNKKSNKPYVLSLSMGSVIYNDESRSLGFEELLALADRNLYEIKMKHKNNSLD